MSRDTQSRAAQGEHLRLGTRMNQSRIAKITAGMLLVGVVAFAANLLAGESKTRNPHSNPPQHTAETSHEMKINIKIDGKILTASLADNATARDFVSVLPLNVSMNDLFGREKYGDLPKALSENGPRKNRYEVGEIAYWSPDHQFAIYYHQDGKSIPSPGIIPIAKIDFGAEAFNVPGSVRVSIALAKQ
jgi:hypothetical protein